MKDDERMEVSGVFRHETPNAYLIDFGTDEDKWTPKSVCCSEEDQDLVEGELYEWSVKVWWLQKEELI
jgi:hypothetical protein